MGWSFFLDFFMCRVLCNGCGFVLYSLWFFMVFIGSGYSGGMGKLLLYFLVWVD